MSKIVYSLAGEGLGHAARARTIVEEVCREHEVTLLASGQAHEFLMQLYDDSDRVRVERIPGLRFHYHRARVAYFRSLGKSLPFLLWLPCHVRSVVRILKRTDPDLALSDFEPLLPRAAKQLGIPLVSCDHQHFLTVCQLGELPWQLRWRAHFIGLPVRLFCTGQREMLVSSFFTAPLNPQVRNATQIGVLLRPEVLSALLADKGHLVVYLRRSVPNLVPALRASGRAVRIYGLGQQPPDGALQFREVDETSFLNDLITCHAVISTAGNQLIGEALYLRKPVLAVPEPGNFEQEINGHFLARTGGGMVRPYQRFSVQDMRDFLDAVPELRRQIDTTNLAGNNAARAVLARYLPCQTMEQSRVA